MEEMIIRADRAELKALEDFLDRVTVATKADERLKYRLSLAAEEIFVNIASYAYRGGNGDVRVVYGETDREIRLTFEDSGIPFDPLKEEMDEETEELAADEDRIGGFGIYMVKTYADSVNYSYSGEKNILTCVFNLGA